MSARTGTVLVAGASGHLGRHVLRDLAGTGVRCRALTRDASRLADHPATNVEVAVGDAGSMGDLRRACSGVESVISCLGASLDLRALRDRSSYAQVDYAGNSRLLQAFQAEGGRRFVYVSVFSTPRLSRTAYVGAHERFAEELVTSCIESVVVRPTGFFCSYLEMLRMARSGRGIVIGSGEARTNPIHEADVAEVCVEALDSPLDVIDIGGPSVLTRREIQEVAFRALDRTPGITHFPVVPFKVATTLLRPLNPRLGALLEFGMVASTVDVIGPSRGRRDLFDYMRSIACQGSMQPRE